MAESKCLSLLLTCTSLICFCNCQDTVVATIGRLGQFEEELLDTKDDMIRMEKRIHNIIDDAKTSLRAELKENIRDQVREAMAEILQGESLQDMVKSQVVSELRHLKQGYHQMKRQMHHVSRSLKDFKDETTVFHQSVLKEGHVWIRENTSDCVRDKHRLEMELQKWDVTAADLKAEIKRCMALKETCQSQISQLKTAPVVPFTTPAAVNVTSTSRSPVSTISVTTHRPPLSTRSATTLRPPLSVTTPTSEEVKSRILIAPLWSGTQHQFRQLNIHSNSLSVYQYHAMKNVISVACIAKTQKLVTGSYSPNRISASTLDTSHMTVLREGVQTHGMAVDEDRDIVFIATRQPQYSISRMSTQGKDFTAIIDLSKYGSYPRQLTLDTRRKRIYGCNGGKLFTVGYDGHGLAILATGSSMYAVTLDQTAGVLYYNNERKLMKMTVSNNVSTEVTTLKARPSTMILYRGTIYHGSLGSPIIGAVNVTYNTRAYILNSVAVFGAYSFILCLIP